jgi:HK97 family phage portal protein
MIGRDLIMRVSSWLARAAEGEYRPGPYYLPYSGGVLSAEAGQYMNWWQLGYNVEGMSSQSAMLEACVSAYSQTVAMCPGGHWRLKSNGGKERVTTSALSRILKYPNGYQSISDFMLNATRSLYLEGNAYALALRNDRFEVAELHLMDPRLSYPQVAVTGDIFYNLAGNDVIDRQISKSLVVPARDVLHVRLHCSNQLPFPLIGETPLRAAAQDLVTGNAIAQQQIQFYLNQSRPSAVLTTDAELTREQMEFARAAWNEQARALYGVNSAGPGGVPILAHGLKVQPWGTPAKDAQIAEILKLTDEKIALAFRIPLAILGIGDQAFSSTELLNQSWVSSGLGFCLNHIEEAFGLLFQLKGQPDEYVAFDTSALLRSAFKDRIDGLVRAVQGGILSPNEARAIEEYEAVEFGDEPRVQQQVVPLSAAASIKPSSSSGFGGGIPPAPGPEAPPAPPPAKEPAKEPAKDFDAVLKWHIRGVCNAADRFDRTHAA